MVSSVDCTLPSWPAGTSSGLISVSSTDADIRQMRRHSRLIDESNTEELLQHWVRVQAVLEADGRGVRVAPDRVHLDTGRNKGWIPDRNMKYELVDASRDGWIITIAVGRPVPPATRP